MSGISSKALNFGGPGNRNKYTNNEKQEKEFIDGSGLEEYDYGARHYNPQIGKWQCIDPLAEKYLSFSPFQYSFNNPILFKDADGRDVIIYNKSGDRIATFNKCGVDIAKGKELSPELTAYLVARTYLGGLTSKPLAALENSDYLTSIDIYTDVRSIYVPPDTHIKSWYDWKKKKIVFTHIRNMSIDNGRITWNPLEAMSDEEGNQHSPALILDHEVKHALSVLLDLDAYFKSKFKKYDDGTVNEDERNATSLTNNDSKELNNGDGGYGKRIKHDGPRIYFYPTFVTGGLIDLINEIMRMNQKAPEKEKKAF